MNINIILIFKAIIIAIVEGITEFIPVSSTGHMIIVGDVINFKGSFSNVFEVVIQLGAILAIIVLYWDKLFKSIIQFLKGIILFIKNICINIFLPKSKKKVLNEKEKQGITFWKNILVACLPAAIMGFLFDDFIDKYLFNSFTVAIGLLVGGILLIITENYFKNKFVTRNVDDLTTRQAFRVGVFQCLALWPGMSRSSSTIIGGWASGVSTVAATEFSFFLAIPIMVGATGLKLYKNFGMFSSGEILVLVIGFLVAFVVALVVVEKFINYLKKKPMKSFAIYRIIVSIVLFILIFKTY
ncbi:undecaprenyl-diphosphate phosphatase [Clostridium ihumii]|uniref:undecaprenyl-diphosphate phosphatase n=1 Tax=Clostridium ihumii TaxID=1470356 RepID=UPI003D354A42